MLDKSSSIRMSMSSKKLIIKQLNNNHNDLRSLPQGNYIPSPLEGEGQGERDKFLIP
jgi:hypothetical protein